MIGNPVLNTEIYKDVPDLPYEISNLGNLRRKSDYPFKHKNKGYIKSYINNKGYVCVHCYKNSKVYKFQIHRLLAILFIPNPDNLPEINHIDGNPKNNALRNLEWCTHQQNTQHAWNTGLFTNRFVNAGVKRKKATSQYQGVSWSESRKRWCAYVGFKKRSYSAGRFKNEIEAAKAYDALIIRMNLQQYGYKLNFS